MGPGPNSPRVPVRRLILGSWLGLAGLIVAAGALFSFLLLFFLDFIAHFSNPYIGILTYLIAPGFLVLGLLMAGVGVLWRRFQVRRAQGEPPPVRIDFSRPHDRRVAAIFGLGAAGFLLLSAFGSYQTYHFTESVEFCGRTCHTVMQPELTTYLHSPHARVSCTECHIGPGATWFVRSKLSGTYQVYATLAHKYPRPILTPVHNLRPAQQTCEQCHWPKMFSGNLDRLYTYFLSDKTNPPFSLRMLLKVGGGDPTYGPVGGIHWHMSVANKVEYVASDEKRQTIPWVRMTDLRSQQVTVFHVPSFTNAPAPETIRRMDCMDCHNRPAHIYQSPNDAVDVAMALRRIDRGLPYIKSNAVQVLTRHYTNETQALQTIASFLSNTYSDQPEPARGAIAAVQQIYTNNFFPKMRADWSVYPNNLGHKFWPGCFRCHDGKHVAEDGKQTIKANDCNACHLILSQGAGPDLDRMDARGLNFDHPGGPLSPGDQCTECHNGSL